MKITKRLPLFLLFVLFIFSSCTKDHDNIGNEKKSLKIAEAKEFFEDNADDIRFIRFSKDSSEITKAGTDLTENIMPDWSNCKRGESGYSYTVEVPLTMPHKLAGIMISGKGHRFNKIKDISVHSVLIIERSKLSGKMRYKIMTTVGSDSGKENRDKFYFYSGDRNLFTGYTIFYSIKGEYRNAFKYEAGKRHRVFMAPLKYGRDSMGKELGYKGFRLFLFKATGTKGGGGYTSGEDNICVICGGNIEDGVCKKCGEYYLDTIVVEDEQICAVCHNPKSDCRCCPICRNYPCTCDDNTHGWTCPYCGSPDCYGECQDLDDEDDEKDDHGGGDDGLTPKDSTKIYSVDIVMSEGFGGSTSGEGEYEKGTTAVVTASANSNYIFGGWTDTGALVCTGSVYSFQVDKNTTLMANFFLKTSDCGKLISKYKNNTSLQSAMGNIRSKVANNARLEYTYTASDSGTLEFFQGTDTKTTINFENLNSCDFIIHNHPSGIPILSGSDLYGLYQLIVNNKGHIGTRMIVQTDNGAMSAEIEDVSVFLKFCDEHFASDNNIESYDSDFKKEIMEQATATQSKTIEYINKAINYFQQNGLKVAFCFGDSASQDWPYAKYANNITSFYDCLTKI